MHLEGTAEDAGEREHVVDLVGVVRAAGRHDPGVAARYAAVVATGRSDYPNQINNVLAFPGIFRGLLDAQARDITDAMLLAASTAIADVVTEPNPSFIVPSVFDPAVAKAVADAVRGAARVLKT